MADPLLTFIGGGNMATSIVGGLIAEGYDAKAITVCDPLPENLHKLQQEFAVQTTTDNAVGAANADTVLLAVKPQAMKTVCASVQPALQRNPLIISIAAGITLRQLNQLLGDELAIIRCMPNTPALLRAGASGLFANSHTNSEQRALGERILGAVGIVEWLDSEALIDAVTAVSGSGPAYFFLLMEAMINAGIEQGLTQEIARRLTIQTCCGAGLLAQNSDVDVAELRRRVTSPGGTTERAVQLFENNQFGSIVRKAITAAADRAREMAKDSEK